MIFDMPAVNAGFEDRLEQLADQLRSKGSEYAMLHEHQRCKSIDHLQKELDRVESLQGEGLMLRQPNSKYVVGRSTTLLKVKRFHDDEAVVLEHQAGKGKHKGKLGALLVQLKGGTIFSIGTGFSDAQRAAPPAVGTTVTFRYQELTDGGVPRFPSFVRVFGGGTKTAK